MFFKGVIIVAAIVFGVITIAVSFQYDFENSQYSFDDRTAKDSEKIIDITTQFIVTSPTFSYDGIFETLEIKIISSDYSNSKFLLEGKFKTIHAGYGNRKNLDLPEDDTLHTIMISIADEKIISAIIDNRWDELNQITCNAAFC